MNYYVHDIETVNARIFKKRKFQFDYIEPDSFEKIQDGGMAAIIGCIKLKEIDKEDAIDKVVISNGLTDHYFKLMSADKIKHLSRRKLIGYILVSKDTYVSVYKKSRLIPFLLSIAFLVILCVVAL